MKAAFYTLGCKVNQNETGALQQMFAEAGYQIVPATEAADVYIVNSCTVTAGGNAKSRQWLRRAKRENPAAVTVLTGCYPQAVPSIESLPPADIITGTAARGKLLQNLQAFLATGKKVVDIVPHQKNEVFEELPAEQLQGRTRAFVKIQDGCNRRCAYCIIPKARGPVRSRSQNNILQELEALAATGHKEVVFTGINLPSYGRDTGTNLADIVEAAALVPGIERIRLSSLDPDLISETLARRFGGVKKLCPSFHLSLQSGCNATLARMRRPYTAEQYWQAAENLRSALPNASFTTDVIVGFPA
ncbi:MAG: MiaB/RimO family radical SAM methylthiotransferase [Oscillospiraceae bacterium]